MMTLEQAIKMINQIRPALGHETNQALDVIMAASPCDVCRYKPPHGPVCEKCPAERMVSDG